MKTPAKTKCNNFKGQAVLNTWGAEPNHLKEKTMKTPVSNNGKFNAIYKELKINLPRDYSETEILEATYSILETHKDDIRRDKSILQETEGYEELDFSDPDYSDLKYYFPATDSGLLENHSVDGMFVPDSYIVKKIVSGNIGQGV